MLLLMVVGTAVFFLARGALSPEMRAWLGDHLMLFLAGLGALMLLVVAAVMRIGRYYLYAALAIAVLLACQMWNAPIALYWIAPGLLLTIGGGLLLYRFVRSHPQA